jgi:hypothetical protein
MGDLMLKQKAPRMPHWQGVDVMARKPWPSAYPQRMNNSKSSFKFRPADPPAWREPSPYSYQAPLYNYQTNSKREHYFLAPYYRNAMPPPPNPNRLLMIDPTRRRLSVKQSDESPCHCRSRSMEDVRTDVITSEWEDDVNGNRVPLPIRNERFTKYSNRRSMDNLLVDTNYSPPMKRAGRLQVMVSYFFFNLADAFLIEVNFRRMLLG